MNPGTCKFRVYERALHVVCRSCGMVFWVNPRCAGRLTRTVWGREDECQSFANEDRLSAASRQTAERTSINRLSLYFLPLWFPRFS